MPILTPYAPAVAHDWLERAPGTSTRNVHGTLVFVDVSGFTALTERLTRRGKVGAEQLTGILDGTFGRMLGLAYAEGADLLKWGGDAMLLLFQGEGHAVRATRAARGMRKTLEQRTGADRRSGTDRRMEPSRRRDPGRAHDGGRRGEEDARRVSRRAPDVSTLDMSVGVHTGTFLLMMVGNPAEHLEILLVGEDATRTVHMEASASAGQIVVSEETAASIPARQVGRRAGAGRLLRSGPIADADMVDTVRTGAAVLVPVDVRNHLQQATGESEHRRAAIAFVRFSGTDALCRQRGPAVVATHLDRLIRHVQEACVEHGVSFLASDLDADGGKLLLCAGAPINRGHVEERMLRTARAICDGVYPFTVQAGVNTGAVFAGDFGPPFRRTYTIIGDAVNLPARLAAKAAPGEVVASRAALSASRAVFDLTELEPFAVKGKREPIAACIVGPLVEEAEADRFDPAEMAGRDHEMAALHAAAEGARTGTGRAIVIHGASGMGLSRIHREAQSTAGLAVHRTAGDEYQRSTAYARFRPLLRSMLGLPRDVRDSQAARALTDAVRTKAPDLEPWVPLFAMVLNVPVASTPEVDALAEEFRRDKLEAMTLDLLTRVLDTPALIAVDDAHLLDEASLSLLAALMGAAAGRPWVVLVTGHTGASWLEGLPGSAEMLELAPLRDEDAMRVVREVMRDHPLPPADVQAVIARAEGSPSFLVSLVRAALAGESLGQLPHSVEDMVAHQIDVLSPPDRALLRTAAVLGMAFSVMDLQELVDARAVPDVAAALPRLRFLIQREHGDRYRFARGLVRDTAYEGLPFRTRKRLHAKAAALIESRVDDPMAVCEVLSVHYARAGVARKAWDYSIAAAQRAETKSAYVDAAEFFRQGLTSSARRRLITAEDRARVWIALGDAEDRVGRLGEALIAYRQARGLTSDDAQRLEALASQAYVLLRQGDYHRCQRVIASSLPRTARDDAAPIRRWRSELLVVRANVRAQQGRVAEALDVARAACDEAQLSGSLDAQAKANSVLQLCMSMQGMTSRQPGRRAIDFFRAAGNRRGQFEVLNYFAVADWYAGRARRSLRSLEACVRLAGEAGDTRGHALARANVGDVLTRLGRFIEAKDLLRQALETFSDLGIGTYVATVLRSQALALAGSGEAHMALTLLDRAQAIQGRLGEEDELTESLLVRAYALLVLGDPAGGLESAGTACDRAAGAQATYLLAPAHRTRASALVDLGCPAEGLYALQLARKGLPDAGFEAGFIHAELTRAHLALGHPGMAAKHARGSRRAFARLGFVGMVRYPIAPGPG